MKSTPIYLLDDEPELVALLADVAAAEGLSPRGYTAAARLFEDVSAFEPGAILVLDLHMPDMDGIEVMRRLAELKDSPALILVSGTHSGVLHAAQTLGEEHRLEILAALKKPVAVNEFRGLLRAYADTGGKGRWAAGCEVGSGLTLAELDRAILEDQLVLYFQPQCAIADARVTGAEALVRWRHPHQGLVLPDGFVPLAERNGRIGSLTHWVIGQVVRQHRAWRDAGLETCLSVNISASDITSLTLPEQLAALLADNRLDPNGLVLELTETALMGELVTSLDILTRMRLKGLGLSIDDFGTGYSSLSQLHRAPFSELKIDRSFVAHMIEDPEARSIVKTCILLGHELDMRVVAEGVEDRATWDLLAELGCDLAQGYFIARPMPAEAFPTWVEGWGL